MNPFDLFADALWKFHLTGKANLRVERDDGHLGREDVSWYFTRYAQFPTYEKRALKFARGKVLDIGCGAGRHSLHLQARGMRVTAIDASPRIVELARTRGVRDARVAEACGKMPFAKNQFDTVILFGNNLGICGTLPRFRKMLRELHRITSPRGRIIATTRMPSTTRAQHRRYFRQNLERGRAVGQVRLRLVYRGRRGVEFDLLLLAPTDLMQIAAREGWELREVCAKNFEEGYAVVLEKNSS
ncbi:MAG: class I SAM-dependent methyltransferase [Chloroflexi bacterium]|nr:class I SAM-dependent methyltransferase [Chloroflexota bacterium]